MAMGETLSYLEHLVLQDQVLQVDSRNYVYSLHACSGGTRQLPAIDAPPGWRGPPPLRRPKCAVRRP
jgi:hypothetical protein